MFSNVPIFLTFFLILIIAYAIRRAQIESRRKKREQEFWDREEAAKRAPAVNLEQIDYIKPPLEQFPFNSVDDDEVLLIEDEIGEIAGRRMLNINGMSNTDIRLEYGTANFDAVSEMGESFNRLLTLLCDYAKALIENDRYEDALSVLEYGASIDSDISANYTLLGDCYRKLGRISDLEKLIDTVAHSKLLLKDSILEELRQEGNTSK